jgi:hypothetical protein
MKKKRSKTKKESIHEDVIRSAAESKKLPQWVRAFYAQVDALGKSNNSK